MIITEIDDARKFLQQCEGLIVQNKGLQQQIEILQDLVKRSAAGIWRTDKPPREGTQILGYWLGINAVELVFYVEAKEGWCYGENYYLYRDPDKWAYINIPKEDK